ncbi:MAG: hypothetical protein ABI333_22130 [bacterium]
MKFATKNGIVVLCVGLCLAMFAGCGDDDNPGDNNNTMQDAAVDAAPDAEVGESLTFVIYTFSDTDATYIPAEGVSVAFDAPGGVRTEADSGADGKVTFTGVDWTAGLGAVTFYQFGYAMFSSVNLDPDRMADWVNEDGEYAMSLSPLTTETPEMVTVSGTATGLADTSHYYTVNTTNTEGQGTEWSGFGTQGFSIQVPSGEPFYFQSLEAEYTELPSGQGYNRPIYGVMHMDYGPLTANETGVELDFGAYGMTTHTADVSMLMPPRTDSPMRTGSIPYCFFCATNSVYCHGWPTYLDVVDNQNRIDISFLWVEPTYPEDLFWFCYVAGQSGELAQTIVPGTPQQDAEGTLIDTPTWVTPSDPLVAHPIADPVEVTYYEDVEISSLSIKRGGMAVWYVDGGPNATTMTIPALPSWVVSSQFLGANPSMTAYGGMVNAEGTRWQRYAAGVTARLEP